MEANTGRIVPYSQVRLSVINGSGEVVETRKLHFYYSEFFHYATNFSIPHPGSYTLKATITAPSFRRHADPGEPAPLASGATVTFRDVAIESD